MASFNLDSTCGALRVGADRLRLFIQPLGGHYTLQGWEAATEGCSLSFEGLSEQILHMRVENTATGRYRTTDLYLTCEGDFAPTGVSLDPDYDDQDIFPHPFNVDNQPVTADEFAAALQRLVPAQ